MTWLESERGIVPSRDFDFDAATSYGRQSLDANAAEWPSLLSSSQAFCQQHWHSGDPSSSAKAGRPPSSCEALRSGSEAPFNNPGLESVKAWSDGRTCPPFRDEANAKLMVHHAADAAAAERQGHSVQGRATQNATGYTRITGECKPPDGKQFSRTKQVDVPPTSSSKECATHCDLDPDCIGWSEVENWRHFGGGNANGKCVLYFGDGISYDGSSTVLQMHQFSDRKCEYGKTFGMDFGKLWATNGCKGGFLTDSLTRYEKCESNDFKTKWCGQHALSTSCYIRHPPPGKRCTHSHGSAPEGFAANLYTCPAEVPICDMQSGSGAIPRGLGNQPVYGKCKADPSRIAEAKYKSTKGYCRGGSATWEDGEMWKCVGENGAKTQMSENECRLACDDDPKCKAFDRPDTEGNADCCLFKEGYTGDSRSGGACHVSGRAT